MFEYAVSNGEGTLLDYGVTDMAGMFSLLDTALDEDQTMIFGPASADCTTGQ